MGRAEFGVSCHGIARRALHGCLLLTLLATLIVVSPVAEQAADAAVIFPTGFDAAKETSTSIDAMVYGGPSINPNSPNTTSVVDLNALGMWSYQQPFYPDNLQSHPGYAAKINGMEPPANGNFWFPQYHNDHVYFAHYSICFNNNLPDGTGCQTESQSIGVYDIVNHSYFRVDIPSVLGQPAPVHGSISDIKINPRNQRLYYIGYPNYIGWINFNAGTGRFDGGAGFGLAKYKDQMPQPAQVANEFDILPTNDLVVINRNNPRIEIFDLDLGLRHTFHPGGSPLVPLSVTTSPRCQRTDPNAGCVAGRFAVNFESTSVTVDTESAHPIRDYVYNRQDNGITRLSPLLIPTSDVWLGGNTVQSGGHLAANVDADYKGIKYDADGVLWAGTFHRAYPYNPAQVFAWVPQHDTSGAQGDSYPWDSQYSGPYRSSCDPNPKTIGSMTAAFIGCRPRGEGVPKQIFQSSGRLVDSIVQAGPNVYWQGWGGSMEGVIRMNPGQMPPEYKRDARWGPAQTRPSWPREIDLGCTGEQSGTIANPASPPDAYVLHRCAKGIGAIRVPQNVQDQYAGKGWNSPFDGQKLLFGIPDQVNRFVYDPARNAIWGTIQSFFDLDIPRRGARSCASQPVDGENTACPLISDNVKLPQWLMRHNLGAPTEQQAYIADPTGSVAGNRGDRLTVGAQIYSVNQPVVTISCTPVCFGASGSSPVSVSPVAPGLWQATARVDVPA